MTKGRRIKGQISCRDAYYTLNLKGIPMTVDQLIKQLDLTTSGVNADEVTTQRLVILDIDDKRKRLYLRPVQEYVSARTIRSDLKTPLADIPEHYKVYLAYVKTHGKPFSADDFKCYTKGDFDRTYDFPYTNLGILYQPTIRITELLR